MFLPWCEKHNKVIFLGHFYRKCIACILDGINVIIMCYTNNNTAYKTQTNRPHFTADSSVIKQFNDKSLSYNDWPAHIQPITPHYHTQVFSAETSCYLCYTPRFTNILVFHSICSYGFDCARFALNAHWTTVQGSDRGKFGWLFSGVLQRVGLYVDIDVNEEYAFTIFMTKVRPDKCHSEYGGSTVLQNVV